MTRAVTWIVLITAVGAATGLFLLKNQVQSLETALRLERNAIRSEYRAIEVLEAEWSFLNNPERLARLAGQFLDLKPLTMAQTLPIDAIPILPADPAPIRPAGLTNDVAPSVRNTPIPLIEPTLATARGNPTLKSAQ